MHYVFLMRLETLKCVFEACVSKFYSDVVFFDLFIYVSCMQGMERKKWSSAGADPEFWMREPKHKNKFYTLRRKSLTWSIYTFSSGCNVLTFYVLYVYIHANSEW